LSSTRDTDVEGKIATQEGDDLTGELWTCEKRVTSVQVELEVDQEEALPSAECRPLPQIDVAIANHLAGLARSRDCRTDYIPSSFRNPHRPPTLFGNIRPLYECQAAGSLQCASSISASGAMTGTEAMMAFVLRG